MSRYKSIVPGSGDCSVKLRGFETWVGVLLTTEDLLRNAV